MSRLRPPRYKKGPRTFQEFRQEMKLLTDHPLAFGLWAILSSLIARYARDNWVISSLIFWWVCSVIIIATYYFVSVDRRSSMVRLPWYKPWAILFLVITLPWLIVWIASLVRLIISDPRKDIAKPPIEI